MAQHHETGRPGVEIEALPPERRTRRSLILLGDGCCCCCCCCLHSVGGLVGAIRASRKRVAVPDPAAEDTPGRGSGVGIYWLTLAGVCAAIVGPAAGFGRGVDGVEVGLVGILMGLPLVQLVAALVAVIVVKCLPKTIIDDKRPEMRTIGRIALYSFGGAVLGLIIMIGGFYVLTGSGVLR